MSDIANHVGATVPAPGRRVFRPPLAPRLFGLFAVIVCGCATIFFMVVAVYGLIYQWPVGLLNTALACFMAALTEYVWRDLKGKWGLRIILDHDAATLDLPANRSLIHRPREQHLVIRYDDIAAIETRLEAYQSLGAVMMQRAYVLRRKNGDLIFLFEERALGTAIETSMFTEIANELADRAGVELRDLGMVEGDGGVIGLWGTHAADWQTPALPPSRQHRLWRQAALLGTVTMIIIVASIVIRLAFSVM
jgi:hypothetical protein